MPEAAADPRFANIPGRTRHIDALYTLAAQVIETRSTAEWLEVFARL
jgi:formyl-CoA transferase